MTIKWKLVDIKYLHWDKINWKVHTEWTATQLKHYYKNNIEELNNRYKLKYLFKTDWKRQYKINIWKVYKEYKQNNYF